MTVYELIIVCFVKYLQRKFITPPETYKSIQIQKPASNNFEIE